MSNNECNACGHDWSWHGMHVSADIAARWTLEQYEAWCVAWPMGVIVVKLEREQR